MAAVEGVLALMTGNLMSVMVAVFKYRGKKKFLALCFFNSVLKVHWNTENKELISSRLEYSSVSHRGQNAIARDVRPPLSPAVLPPKASADAQYLYAFHGGEQARIYLFDITREAMKWWAQWKTKIKEMLSFIPAFETNFLGSSVHSAMYKPNLGSGNVSWNL